VMTAADPPSAAVLLSTDGPVDRTAIARAIESVERERDTEDDDVVDEDTPRRAPEGLYWRAFAAMKTAHARIQAYEEAESSFAPDDVEWAAAIGLDEVNAAIQAVEAARGTWRMTLEEANEKAAALLMGMRAIALVMRNPLADNRREISDEDREKRFNVTSAIGYLLRLLDELASDGAAERWMSDDARGPQWDRPDEAEREAA
ncbi:MAG: hypothetical protein ACREM1_25260, partial [Longimicrobiales bacterium]